MAVNVAHALARYVRKAVYPQRVALCDHESLKSADAADKISVVLGKIFSHEAEVILARARIEQMAAGGMRLAAFYRHYAAHRADVSRAEAYAVIGAVQHIGKLVNKRIVASYDNEAMPELILIRQQAHPDMVSALEALDLLRNFHYAVGLHERRDHAASAAERRRCELIADISHAHTDKLAVFKPRHNRAR